MSDWPGVDVIIAARDEERDLPACLTSLGAQRYRGPIHVLVAVDERTRDDTARKALLHGATVCTGGRGPAATRNRAFRAGTGPLVAFLDAHSIAHPDWLEALVARRRQTGVAGVGGTIEHLYDGPPAASPATYDGRSAYAWLKTGNALFCREALERVGGFDVSLRSSEDVDLSWRLLRAGYPLAYSPKARVTHLDRGGRARHLLRNFWHGVGAAQLAHRFDLRPPSFSLKSLSLSCYSLGSVVGRKLYASRLRPYSPPPIHHRWTTWTAELSVRPAPGALWWYPPDGEVVLVDDTRRWGIGGAGELFWRCLTLGWSRSVTLARVARTARREVGDIDRDLDAWTEMLEREGWLEKRYSSSGE